MYRVIIDFFFFSSRRRHTRYWRDWSSDVCSSDLGEPYILHPLAVARICVEEIGLGVRSTICSLLHDTVEDTDIILDDVQREFGSEIAKIVDGLTKISNVIDVNASQQAENFRKILLTLTDDPRVILIKLADRLHNMRTLDSMKQEKQLKISSETVYVRS